MLKNNIEVDVKVKCIEVGLTQAKLAEQVGTTPAYVNRLIKKQEKIINNTFAKMMEKLGYDIELWKRFYVNSERTTDTTWCVGK